MKPLLRVVPCLFAFAMVVGCASTTVTERHTQMGMEKLPRPDVMYVYPFAATPTDIPPWSAARSRYAAPSRPPTAEEIEAGRKLGALVAQELVGEFQEMGLPSVVAGSHATPRLNDILIIGYFASIETGSATKRLALGFGAGAAQLQTVVEGYQMTHEGLRQLGSGTLQAGGSKIPGVSAPLLVFAATANPIGLVVGGVAKVAGEVTGRDTIEGAAKRTAKAIADQLRAKIQAQGWSY